MFRFFFSVDIYLEISELLSLLILTGPILLTRNANCRSLQNMTSMQDSIVTEGKCPV